MMGELPTPPQAVGVGEWHSEEFPELPPLVLAVAVVVTTTFPLLRFIVGNSQEPNSLDVNGCIHITINVKQFLKVKVSPD